MLSLDLHASQIQGFFNIPFDHLSASTLFISYFKKKKLDNLVVASPDVGRIKLVKEFADRLGAGLAIIYKSKRNQKVEDMIMVGKVEGKRVLLVDDMIDTASTLMKAVKTLKKAGAKEIFACVTHPILSGKAIKRLKDAPIKEVIFSNSIPIEAQKMLPKFEVLSVGPLLTIAIKNIHKDKSISQLFASDDRM